MRRRERHRIVLFDAIQDGKVEGQSSRRWRQRQDRDWQERRREAERQLRLRCVAAVRWASWSPLGWTLERFADELGVEPRTLRGWQDIVGQQAKAQGAPARRATPEQRREVADFLTLWYHQCSFRDLEEHFPDLSRGELGQLYWAYHIAREPDQVLYLRWTTPGAVWAIDFSHADHQIDQRYPYLLVIRDVASGFLLAAIPCTRATGEMAAAALASLFSRYSVPLVLKSDNGSHFVNELLRELLVQHGVTLLLSPPYYPPYNGACEAGIGGLKARIHLRAVRDDDPTIWTSDHVEAARQDGNHRDHRRCGFTPVERWSLVTPFSDDERLRFQESAQAEIRRHIAEADRRKLDERPPLHTLVRRGIADALMGAGYLLIRSRRVPQPLSESKAE